MRQSIEICILAAGMSRRFGSPKALAQLDGKALLQHSLDLANSTNAERVSVVLGAHETRIRASLDFGSVTVLSNPDYAEGIASSIRTAAEQCIQHGLLLLAMDQALIRPPQLQALIDLWRADPTKTCAAKYGDASGIPAVFPRSYFPRLLDLQGEQGARAFLDGKTQLLAMPEAAHDIDTAHDLAEAAKIRSGRR